MTIRYANIIGKSKSEGGTYDCKECIYGRRSIRKYKPDPVDHALLESVIEAASYAPSWKHSQTIRYIAIEGELKDKIGRDCTTIFPNNGKIIENAPLLIAVTVIKNRCGYERDGSFSTERGDTWQMYDAGVASQTFCLAAYEAGLGTVIMGLFDNDKITSLLEIPEDRELVALIPVGYPDETPAAPKRKAVADLLTYK